MIYCVACCIFNNKDNTKYFKKGVIMLKKITASVLLTASLLSTTSLAESDLSKIYSECGLGGLIAQGIQDRDTSNLVAISTNVTWDLGTTASSTYYSTGEDSCANKKVRVALFINQSFDKLEKEIAQGTGKYLDGLANLALDDKKMKAEYISSLRKKFSEVIADKKYSKLSHNEKVEKLYSIAI